MAKPTQQATRDWVLAVLKATGWSPHRLATEAGVSPSTVHRALNDPRFVTKDTTLAKLAAAANTNKPARHRSVAHPGILGGFAEPEAIFVSPDEFATEYAIRLMDGEAVWRLNSRAIELAGYRPGDYLLVSQHVTARAGDAVCVQLYNLQLGSAETVFRIFEPPFVDVRSMDPTISSTPQLVDNHRAMIWGTVRLSLRVRRD